MLDHYLITHCAPTLASIKTANLFSIRYERTATIRDAVELYNGFFAEKGVKLLLLKAENHMALIYVYRPERLQRDLEKRGVAQFLQTYGYASVEADACIRRLRERLSASDAFPHEIGIFLGYPLGDVIGFIQNAGQNCKCTGCWKVYCNECEAIRTFALYKKCSRIYARLLQEGKSVMQLTV